MSNIERSLYQVGEQKLHTHPAADVLPLTTGDEFTELVADIATNGLHEPVWLYDDREHGTVLLDGRNRAAACLVAGVVVTSRWYTGDDPIGFVESEGLRTRHLSPGQITFARLRFSGLRETDAAAKRRAQATGQPRGTKQGPSLGAPGPQETKRAPRARDRVAGKGTGTSGRSVARAMRIEAHAPDLAAQVMAGDMDLRRAERIVRDREATTRRVAEVKREADTADQPVTVDIRHGDFRDVLADLTDVDAIITDPPYPAEFLPLLDDLAVWADKVLAPEGVLAVLMGQTHLPEVYRRLDGHRPYRWTCAYLTPGNGYVSHPRKIQSNWKPLLIYGGGPRISDVFTSSGDDKAHHKWGQNYNAFHTIVERLTSRGQVVVDPFMGSGTTLLAAHALGRHTIGADTEQEHVDTARKRLLS